MNPLAIIVYVLFAMYIFYLVSGFIVGISKRWSDRKRFWIEIIIGLSLLIGVIVFSSGTNTSQATNTPYVYGTNPALDSALATPSTVQEKQQCAIDGTAWFQKNVEDSDSEQQITLLNKEFAGNNPSLLMQSASPGSPEYVYSTKMNTCLIDFSNSISYMDGSNSTTHDITDIYSNKIIAEWDWTQKPGESVQDALNASLQSESAFESTEFSLFHQQN